MNKFTTIATGIAALLTMLDIKASLSIAEA
jgi:hypothetical protein